MVQLTWQGSPEVVRKYKKALETLNMLILPHLLKKKKKKDWENFYFINISLPICQPVASFLLVFLLGNMEEISSYEVIMV